MYGEPVRAALTPTGKLRAAINIGNPVLARLTTPTGVPVGVSVDIARELARRLSAPLQYIVVDAAASSVAAISAGEADVGFFAIDPLRGATIAFTACYLTIEGCYLVRRDSAIEDNFGVDTPGVSVVVGAGSAYDLFLTRELKRATLVRVPRSPAVVDTFVERGLKVAAGVKQQLQADAVRYPGLRLLDQPFMVIQQAMGVAKARGEAAATYLRGFVDELKATNFVRGSLKRHGIRGATAA